MISKEKKQAIMKEYALSLIHILADPDEKTALVVVPDYKLSLAIGK